ncbi:MAG: hypothetical protein DCF16_02125 [Alphaproteobacteria bacterium]|nr:MAG: hypothetical protein DCF16_02125 [Alphaproteobacteria bacterium]
MWIYLLLFVPLLFRPTWKLLGLLTLVAIALVAVVGVMTGTPALVTLFYGGINVVAFAALGAVLIIIRRAFTKTTNSTSAES